uniref:Uncharacterized protein n=1 Tax=Timema poppense TaxID=170557 RepID=A0A7R9CFP8_TIMPO|nr:unnamed protein product [Timema poppensis]
MGETETRGERKRKKGGGGERKRQKSQGTPQEQQRSRLVTLIPSWSRPFQLLGDAARTCVRFAMLVSPPYSSLMHPVWNSTLHKGKAQVKVSVQEEIRCIQYNNPNAHDTLDVYGVISCMPQVEGSIPEILLQFSHSETVNNIKTLNNGLHELSAKCSPTSTFENRNQDNKKEEEITSGAFSRL